MSVTIIFLIATIISLSIKNNIYGGGSTATLDELNLVQIPLIPHHVQQERRRRQRHRLRRRRRRRRRSLQEQPEETRPPALKERSSPLYQGKGTHYVDLWIGTPPQRQTVIVDTGSGFTAVPCSECQDCGSPEYHTDNYFLQNQSSTFQDSFATCEECTFGECNSEHRCVRTVKYGEGSQWTAHEVIDMVYTGGPTHETPSEQLLRDAFKLRFGCQTHLTGLFKTQLADGIMGMDKSFTTTFWKQAYDNKAISNQAFSLCYSRPSSSSATTAIDEKGSTGTGVMTLGGTDTRLHQTTMVYANQVNPINSNSGSYYTVRIKKIYLRSYHGGTSVNNNAVADEIINPIQIDEATLNGGGIILDSGTTTTHFPKELEEPFAVAFKDITGGRDYKRMIQLTPEEFSLLPTILIQLDGGNHNDKNNDTKSPGLVRNMINVKSDNNTPNNNDIIVAMPPSHYMQYSEEHQTYRLSISFNNPFFLGILGANFMMGHDILFDIDNHRIGFAESNCEYSQTKLETEG